MPEDTPSRDTIEFRLTHLERSMDNLRHEFSDKVDRMEKRSITALGEFKAKLDKMDERLGRVMLVIVALAGGSGSLVTVVVKSLAGGG